MNKAQLIDQLVDTAALNKVQAGKALDSIINNVIGTLKKGDAVTLVGFGTFSVAQRGARIGHNPQTGEKLKIKAKKVPKFKAGKDFSESVDKAKIRKAVQ